MLSFFIRLTFGYKSRVFHLSLLPRNSAASLVTVLAPSLRWISEFSLMEQGKFIRVCVHIPLNKALKRGGFLNLGIRGRISVDYHYEGWRVYVFTAVSLVMMSVGVLSKKSRLLGAARRSPYMVPNS
ncbi:hypothetical protein Dimus_030714 [Dionaea muscipula]